MNTLNLLLSCRAAGRVDSRSVPVAAVVLLCFLVPSPALGQSPDSGTQATVAGPPESVADDSPAVAAETPPPAGRQPESPRLQFNFSGANWKEVLEWFAEQANLSLQMDQSPVGSVNFADPERSYDVREGLDLINRLLLDRGWALIRRGRMLLLIDLESDNADKLIDAQAELVSVETLDDRGRSDIVKCVFPLGSISASDAAEELALLVGPWGRVKVLASAKQVVVTETVDNLRTIRDLLRNAAQAVSNVVQVKLSHRTAGELLEIARPLLGIEPGEDSNDRLRISIGPYGDRIFATGEEGALSLLQSVIEMADTPLELSDGGEETELPLPILVTHQISVADTSTVFDVLQTLLAGAVDARISIDPKTDAIVAYALPETQELIKKTIAELEGNGSSFEVIELKRLDPAQALLTINKFFGVTEGGGEGPTVDGDPVSNRLWVKGTQRQIEAVKRLIDELEGDNNAGLLGDSVRILPFDGESTRRAIAQVNSLWSMTGRPNRIRVVSPSRSDDSGDSGEVPGFGEEGMRQKRLRDDDSFNRTPPERLREPSSSAEPRWQADPTEPAMKDPTPDGEARDSTRPRYRLVTRTGEDAPSSGASKNASDGDDTATPSPDSTPDAPREANAPRGQEDEVGADIVIQVTEAGLVIASKDTAALDAFETLFNSLTTSSTMTSDVPTIYWLKYVKAEVAAELVASVLGGAESTMDSLGDSLTSGLGGGGMLGGLMGLAGGGGGGDSSSSKSILTSTGSVNIVPDARLNALIVQANASDLQFIEMILRRIDVEESPEDVETVAKPRLIPVVYQEAETVANLVKAVFAEKIGGEAGRSRGGGGQPSPQEFIAALRGGGKGGNTKQAQSEAPKMTVAVDTRSNSLVVTATPQDFAEVEALVEQLDQQGMDSEEEVVVIPLNSSLRPEVIQSALDSVLGVASGTSASGADSKSPAGRTSSTSERSGSSAAEIQQRIEFFRSRFGGGGGGAGGRGGSTEGRGRTRGGGGGGGGGRASGRRGG